MQEKKEEDPLQVLNKGLEVGIDEVGRGAVFGPVFSAVVVLTKENTFNLKNFGVKDSKKLTPKKRKLLLPKILLLSSDYGIGQSSVREIEKFGIRVATELSMIRALNKLKEKVFKFYIKTNKKIDLEKFKKDFEILSVLRNLKIIGIFMRLAVRDNKKKYLKLIPYAWKMINHRIKKQNEFSNLMLLLKNNFPKFIR